MKKILVIIMVMILSLFAVACGGGNEPVTTPDGPTDGPIDGPNGAPQLAYSKWQMDDDSMLPDYLPTVEFDTAGHFTFTENVYEIFDCSFFKSLFLHNFSFCTYIYLRYYLYNKNNTISNKKCKYTKFKNIKY